MKKYYEANYSESFDRTFIMEVVEDDDGDLVSEEVVGFYSGEPNEEDTQFFAHGRMKAEYQ